MGGRVFVFFMGLAAMLMLMMPTTNSSRTRTVAERNIAFQPTSDIDVDIQDWVRYSDGAVWHKKQLTYAINVSSVPVTDYVDSDVVRIGFSNAFSTWAAVVPLDFTEINEFEAADIKIWFSGGSGDPLGTRRDTLAYSNRPPAGTSVFDNAEVWTMDVENTDSDDAFDVQTVALHEFGHLIGLDHSADVNAVMYAIIQGRSVKRDLTDDDIQGAQALYGPRS